MFVTPVNRLLALQLARGFTILYHNRRAKRILFKLSD